MGGGTSNSSGSRSFESFLIPEETLMQRHPTAQPLLGAIVVQAVRHTNARVVAHHARATLLDLRRPTESEPKTCAKSRGAVRPQNVSSKREGQTATHRWVDRLADLRHCRHKQSLKHIPGDELCWEDACVVTQRQIPLLVRQTLRAPVDPTTSQHTTVLACSHRYDLK